MANIVSTNTIANIYIFFYSLWWNSVWGSLSITFARSRISFFTFIHLKPSLEINENQWLNYNNPGPTIASISDLSMDSARYFISPISRALVSPFSPYHKEIIHLYRFILIFYLFSDVTFKTDRAFFSFIGQTWVFCTKASFSLVPLSLDLSELIKVISDTGLPLSCNLFYRPSYCIGHPILEDQCHPRIVDTLNLKGN